MRGFPEDGKERRALGYYLGKELSLTHLNGAISAGGNDLIFDNFLNMIGGSNGKNKSIEKQSS